MKAILGRNRNVAIMVLGKVSIESVIYSDGWRGYNGLFQLQIETVII